MKGQISRGQILSRRIPSTACKSFLPRIPHGMGDHHSSVHRIPIVSKGLQSKNVFHCDACWGIQQQADESQSQFPVFT